MNKKLFILYGLAVLLYISTLSACSIYENPKFIELKKIDLIEEVDGKIILKSESDIYNPNWFTIYGKDISFKLYIDTFFIGDGVIKKDLTLKKKDTTSLESMLTIYKSSLDSTINLNDSVTINILGSTKIPKTEKRFYFDFNYKVFIGDVVGGLANDFIQKGDIQISNLNIRNIDLQNIDLNISFKLNNQSNIKYQINTLDIEVYKTSNYKQIIGRSEIEESFIILADTVNKFDCQVKVNTLQAGSALFSNSINNNHSFYIKVFSKVEYNGIEIPSTIKRKAIYNPITLDIELK